MTTRGRQIDASLRIETRGDSTNGQFERLLVCRRKHIDAE
ncbi:hypothetical protein HMPREF0972_01860 [Actinomyces sp. oral taxon 848 str. F0332]|nr:hypothetical protein HMPREF0972_01860 [Actinomyces sp. oral taxon 848 str. F0332]